MPAWAKAFSLAAGSLTVLALGGAAALRIAAPALGDLVDVLDMLFRVALVLAALLFGGAVLARIFVRRATTPLLDDATHTAQEQPPRPRWSSPRTSTPAATASSAAAAASPSNSATATAPSTDHARRPVRLSAPPQAATENRTGRPATSNTCPPGG